MREFALFGFDAEKNPVMVTVTITDEWLQQMANRAARNRTGVSRSGGVTAKVVERRDRDQVRAAFDREVGRRRDERIAWEHAAEGDIWGERRLEADADAYEAWENQR